MLKGRLLHPELLGALGQAGHGAKVLLADGNYPLSIKSPATAARVYLNLAPGVVTVTDVLEALVSAIPIEAAEVMETLKEGPYAMKEDPAIWADFTQVLHDAGADVELGRIERHKFYDVAGTPDVCLTIATGEERIYANLLLTIGVIKPKS